MQFTQKIDNYGLLSSQHFKKKKKKAAFLEASYQREQEKNPALSPQKPKNYYFKNQYCNIYSPAPKLTLESYLAHLGMGRMIKRATEIMKKLMIARASLAFCPPPNLVQHKGPSSEIFTHIKHSKMEA